MKYTFRKFFNLFFMSLISVATIFSLATPASAKQQDGGACRLEASTSTPVIGEPVEFTVQTGLSGTAAVDFGDGTAPENVSLNNHVFHVFHYVGTPVVMVFVRGAQRQYAACTIDLTVSNNPALTQNQSKPEVAPSPVSTQASPVGDNSRHTVVKTEGNNSPAINVTDSNNVTINTGVPSNQPVIVQAAQPVTQRVPWYLAWLHGFYKSAEAFFKYADEGTFPTILVPAQ